MERSPATKRKPAIPPIRLAGTRFLWKKGSALRVIAPRNRRARMNAKAKTGGKVEAIVEFPR